MMCINMKLHVILLLIWSLCHHRVDCSLPDFTPATPLLQVEASVRSKVVSVSMKNEISRLPGLCRRLKRRRISVLCNLEKFCWWGRSPGRSQGRSQRRGQAGQVCRCPRGCRCSHFFVHSL